MMNHPGLCIRENATAPCVLCGYVDQIAALKEERDTAWEAHMRAVSAFDKAEAERDEDAKERVREIVSLNALVRNRDEAVKQYKASADKLEAERDAEKRCADQIADLYNEIVDVIGRENPETDPGTSERVHRIVADNARLKATADTLREAIENAPHNDWCAWLVQNKPCSCWKAAALAAGRKP